MLLSQTSDSGLLRIAANALRPKRRVRPSEWARTNVVLRSEQSAKPGPFDTDWKPFTAALHDVMYDHPDKQGAVAIKPEQIGFSRAVINLVGCIIDTDPGPILYMTTDDRKAQNFADEEFDPMVKGCPSLAGLFAKASEDRRTLTFHKPFTGGVIDFGGAGSESATISVGRRYVILDEYQKSSENFPAASGDLFQAGLGRLTTYKNVGWIYAFGHPRYEMEDIDRLYQVLSTRHAWTFDCPHCQTPVELRWKHVRFASLAADGEAAASLDPATAMLYCCHCGCQITDAERSRALWPARRGGTGRFHSDMPADEMAKRKFVGLAIHRLADPHVTVRELAERFVLCKSDEERQTFFNKGLGEVYTKAEAVVTIESVTKNIKPMSQIILPGTGKAAAMMLVAGSDVQAPRVNPTMYSVAVAYSPDGNAYVVDARRNSGFAAYHAWLASVVVPRDGADPLGIRCAAIDTGYETKAVLDNCRVTLYQARPGGGLVKQLPVKFQPQLNEDNPSQMAPDRKREHPTRPELGLIDYYWLYRHHWVDRLLRRLLEGRLHVLCRPPERWEEQLMSNILRPVRKQHGMERDRAEWVRPDAFQDDWLMALVFAEAAAALDCGLDTLHAIELNRVAGAGEAPAKKRGGSGFGPRFGGGWGGGGGGWGRR